MSQPMEFMDVDVEKGLASKGNQAVNPTTELESAHWNPASQRCLAKHKPIHYLSLVKPQMIQRVLSCRGFCEERKAVSIGSHSDMKGTGERELMELFPQQPGLDTIKPLNTDSCLPLPSHHHLAGKSAHQLQGRFLLTPSRVGVEPPVSRSASSPTTPQKQSSAQFTIFYDGTVNVYDLPEDKAQVVMNMLGGSGNAHQLHADSDFDEGIGCGTTSCFSNRPLICKAAPASAQDEVPTAFPTPKQTATAQRIKEIEILHGAELPLARTQSLRRFLEKRRMRLTPYTSARLAKAVDVKIGHQLTFPLRS